MIQVGDDLLCLSNRGKLAVVKPSPEGLKKISEFQAMPDLDANATAVAIESIKLENEGWERDYQVTEPQEPSFTEPA